MSKCPIVTNVVVNEISTTKLHSWEKMDALLMVMVQMMFFFEENTHGIAVLFSIQCRYYT